MAKFINPFTDWGFKRIFGQELTKDILISFLNALLDGEHVVTDLVFADKEMLPGAKDQRGIIYDVYCTTDCGDHIIVEMQNRTQTSFIDRSTFYISRAVYEQGRKGTNWNYKLDAVYGIFFMNFTTKALEPKPRTDYVLAERFTHTQLTDKIRLIFLQLPYFKNEESQCRTLFDCFIYTLKNMEILDRMPFQARDAVFKRLAEIADRRSLTREEDEQYEETLKVYRDNLAVRQAAFDEGLAVAARRMLDSGMAIGQVASILGLEPDSLRRRLDTLA